MEHGSGGYEAAHLAAAATWQSALDERLTVATYDRQLWRTAKAQGLMVWPAALA